MIKEYNEEIGRRLYETSVNFINYYEVSCEESVFQNDEVVINASYLVGRVCDIVGYFDYEEDEDDE